MISTIEKTDKDIYQRPLELLQNLVRFDTTNPPGNERACIEYIRDLLDSAGIETRILARDINRPNLWARLYRSGNANEPSPAIMLYGHADVVSADVGQWTHPPFSGEIADGFIWGRGVLDMKGALAMMISVFIKAKVENAPLLCDIILCIVSDEEQLGEYGAKYLVENHPGYFSGVRYALGEFGGFTLYVGGKRFYPIEIAQKQKCGFRAILRGPSGHGSGLIRGGAMAKLGQMLSCLDENQLEVHVTPAAEKMFTAIADALPFPSGWIMRLLTKPRLTKTVLKILGEKGTTFVPMFHHTVNATIVRGGEKINVIPNEIEVQLDCRILPGFSPEDVKSELQALLGDGVELEVLFYDPGATEPDMGLYDKLAKLLKDADPEGIPIPLILTATTDARFFSRLGIQTYGFVPMQLPPDMNFNRTIHAVDEKVPIESIEFGTALLYRALLELQP